MKKLKVNISKSRSNVLGIAITCACFVSGAFMNAEGRIFLKCIFESIQKAEGVKTCISRSNALKMATYCAQFIQLAINLPETKRALVIAMH